AEKRNARQGQRCRAADQRDDIGIILEIVAEDRADDLRLVEEAGGEERPDRPVDEARDQRLLLGGAPFALEKAAGNLAGGEGLLLVIDGEREEILPRLCGFGRDRGAEHRRAAICRHHGAIGLAGDLAGLQNEAAAAPIDLLAEYLEHL